MKMTINRTSTEAVFNHSRSETKIIVKSSESGIELLFVDYNSEASISFKLDESNALLDTLKDLSVIDYQNNFTYTAGGIAVEVSKTNYGDPYEECIRFCFFPSDQEPWTHESVTAELSTGEIGRFGCELG